MRNLLKDVRYGLRVLARSRGFTAVAIVSLGLGIGVNTTIFTLVNAVLLRPLPVEEPGRLVQIYSRGPIPEAEYSTLSRPDLIDLREQADAFDGIAGHAMMLATYSDGNRARLVLGEIVTGNYFDVLGVRPARGRGFLPEEDVTPGTRPVAVLGHGFWQRQFGADPDVVGRTVELNGIEHTIVGVAPRRFTGTFPGVATAMWVPTMMADEVEPAGLIMTTGSEVAESRVERRGYRWLFAKGRLAPGATIEQARAQLDTITARLADEYPETNEKHGANVLPADRVRIHPMLDEVLSPAAGLMLGVVALVLLIACANVANMLLARATARRHEIAVRLALGAGRGRLVSQLLTESLMLASAGGLLGLLLAVWLTRLLLAFQPPATAAIDLAIGVDARVFGFTLLVSALTGVAFGLVPALRSSRPELVSALKNVAGRAAGGRGWASLNNALVVAQVAVSLVLLVGAALLARSLQGAQRVDLGFDADRLSYTTLGLEMQGYTRERAVRFFDDAVERVRALPGVDSAAYVRRLPLDINDFNEGVYIPGQVNTPEEPAFLVHSTYVGVGYFETVGVPIVEGRGFLETDTPETPRVAVVNRAMERRYWPQGALGQRFNLDDAGGRPVEIVGVAADHKVMTVGEQVPPYVHFANAQTPSDYGSLLVRSNLEPAAALEAARRELLAMDPELVIFAADPMRELVAIKLLPLRMGAALIGGFALLALGLAAVGLYGVIAYAVGRRTPEIGLRMALGADGRRVLGLVVRQGMTLVGVGAALGLAGAALVSRLLSGVLYDVATLDLASFAAAGALLAAVALLANWIPARRAARTDPMIALRSE